ncbi:MAG: peptidoglycan-associated lipoprotein Pal [Rickettsiales bacterium]|jgi:peptidoglycan-associated lipoprotein|nr:peptidoglycan-associated lipoprotein Pal [Rickettsiales bacterium]
MNKKLILLSTILLLAGCAENYEPVSSAGQSEIEKPSEEKAEKGNKVFFAFNSAVLSKVAKSTLDQLASKLVKEKTSTTVVEGHCDERGTREYNLALGQRRANAVKKYLISKGVASKRIGTKSFGKEKPAVFGKGEAIWSQNRRGVIVVSGE